MVYFLWSEFVSCPYEDQTGYNILEYYKTSLNIWEQL